ncbi:MAG: hypothetical protein RL097_280 [Candidatus Parcubacteria bacterium]|jgi:hypothetical protein
MRKKIFTLFIFGLFLCSAGTVNAASEITIRPLLIDETLPPRGVVENTITIKSVYDYRKAVLYATVNEITLDTAGEIKEFVSPVMTDRTNTVTSWIEISRGRIEVSAGETAEIPLTIRVHPYAEPGEYHVFVGLVEAPNRPAAEAVAMAGEAKGVIVKVTVADERVDSMRIASFVTERFVIDDSDRTVTIALENNGDIASVPTGEIIFYDSRGRELMAVPVNQTAERVEPQGKITLEATIPLENDLGRYKANVFLKYGEDQQGSLQDTTYFYLMPLHLLLLIFGGTLVVAILISLLFRRVFFHHEEDPEFQDIPMYVRDGNDSQPKDHDIDLKNKS